MSYRCTVIRDTCSCHCFVFILCSYLDGRTKNTAFFMKCGRDDSVDMLERQGDRMSGLFVPCLQLVMKYPSDLL